MEPRRAPPAEVDSVAAGRDRAGEPFEESRAAFAAVFQTAPVMMMMVGSDLRVRAINRAAESVVARPVEEMQGRRFGNAVRCIYSLDDPKGCGYGASCKKCPLRHVVLDTFQTKQSQHQVEVELTFGEPQERHQTHLLVSTSLVHLPQDPWVLVCARDITERKRALQALRESEERYRLLFERSLAGVYRTTLEGEMLDCNDSLVSMLGYQSRQEVLSLHASDLYFEPADRETFIARLRKTGALSNSELRLRRKDGTPIHILENVILLPDQQGVLKIIQGTTVDITERKRAEQALRDAHEILERLFATTHVCIAYMDTDFNFIRVNRAYAEADDRTPEFFVGKNHFDLYPDPENQAIFRRAVSLGEPCSFHGKPFEYTEHPERGVTYWDWSLQPVKDAAGRVDAVLLCLVDVTKRMQAEKLARERQAALAHVSRISTIAEMASGLAHELTQPLGAVCTYADACGKMLEAGSLSELAETVDKMAGQARRAAQIVSRIRGFVGKTEPDRDTVDLNNLIKETVSLTEKEAKAARVTVSLELSDQIPLVLADSVQIQQLMVNLVRNGIDAIQQTTHGPRALTIQSSAHPDGTVDIAVRDTGIGLGDEVFQRMFEPFFTTKSDGLGLGLLISRSIAEAHGGRLRTTPNPPRGTVFHLTLPVSGESGNVSC